MPLKAPFHMDGYDWLLAFSSRYKPNYNVQYQVTHTYLRRAGQ